MAVRITIVVVQAAERHGRLSDYEEQLLTQVMLENSLDAVFVGPIEQMTADGTDALCLSKIPANSIVLGWLPPNAAAALLDQLNLPWGILQSQNFGRPTIQYRQIRSEQPIDELMSSLRQVLKNVGIKTLQIALPNSASRAIVPAAARALPAVATSERSGNGEVHKDSNDGRQPTEERSVAPMRPFIPANTSSESERDDLDQLVSDLEALDL